MSAGKQQHEGGKARPGGTSSSAVTSIGECSTRKYQKQQLQLQQQHQQQEQQQQQQQQQEQQQKKLTVRSEGQFLKFPIVSTSSPELSHNPPSSADMRHKTPNKQEGQEEQEGQEGHELQEQVQAKEKPLSREAKRRRRGN